MKENLPPQDLLRRKYRYASGHLISIRSGRTLGSVNSRGYLVLGVSGTNYLVHRLIWRLVHGDCPKTLDHINGDKLDNRLENLRVVTRSANALNTNVRSNNQSGYKGVWWSESKGKWEAGLSFNSERYYLGCFDDLMMAVAARAAKEKEVVCYGG